MFQQTWDENVFLQDATLLTERHTLIHKDSIAFKKLDSDFPFFFFLSHSDSQTDFDGINILHALMINYS